jgi:nitric oxide synthase oxygenase domain/subunit
MFQAVIDHLVYTTNNGQVIPTITVFPQRFPNQQGPKIWNPQVIRYAGYADSEDTVTGDPAHIEFTQVLKMIVYNTNNSDMRKVRMERTRNRVGYPPFNHSGSRRETEVV